MTARRNFSLDFSSSVEVAIGFLYMWKLSKSAQKIRSQRAIECKFIAPFLRYVRASSPYLHFVNI